MWYVVVSALARDLNKLLQCACMQATLDDRVLSIACNEVVSPDYVKIVPSEGMPVAKQVGPVAERGDLTIRFKIRFPAHLTDDRRSGLNVLLSGSGPLPKLKLKTRRAESKETDD